MSAISEQVKELRTFGAMSVLDMIEPEILRKQLNDAADTIETLSAKLQTANMERSTAYYNGGWIPCSVILPEYDKCVLACIKPCDISLLYFGLDDSWRFAHNDEFVKGIVLAWQPLPEPYKPQ